MECLPQRQYGVFAPATTWGVYPSASAQRVVWADAAAAYPFGRAGTSGVPVSVAQGDSLSQSARGLAQSKTLREFMAGWSGRQLLDCASPLALSDDAATPP